MILNDFRLKNMSNGLFDIDIQDYNFINVTDNEQVRNSVILALFTLQDEISEQNPIYSGFGSRLMELVKTRQNSMTEHLIKEYVRESLLKVHNIAEINNITVTEKRTGAYQIHININTENETSENFDFEMNIIGE